MVSMGGPGVTCLPTPCSGIAPRFIDDGSDISDSGSGWIIFKPRPTNVDEGDDQKKESDDDTKVERLDGEEIRRIRKFLDFEKQKEEQRENEEYFVGYLCVAGAIFVLGILFGKVQHVFFSLRTQPLKNN